MDKRKAVRYSSNLLPDGMSRATIQWDGGLQIETTMVSCSAQGMGVVIPPLHSLPRIPNKHENILVKLLIAEIWFTGVCVYAMSEEDGSVSIGIYFNNPYEQNHLQHLLYKALREHHHARATTGQ